MGETKRKCIVLTILVLALSALLPYFSISNRVSSFDVTPTVSLDPQSIKEQVLNTFEINLTVANVANLTGFLFRIYYFPGTLRVLEINEGSMFMNETEGEFNPEDHSEKGEIYVERTSTLRTTPRNGNGTLVALKFQCILVGTRSLGFGGNLFNRTRDPISYNPQPNSQYIEYIVERRRDPIEVEQNYTLYADVDFSDLGPLFMIKADNLVFDLNGHTINSTEGVGTAIEVANRKGVTIENGTIARFQWGIEISNCRKVNIFNLVQLNSEGTAVNIVDSSDIHICNNKMSRNIKECISLSNCSFSEFSHNTLTNNRRYAIDMKKNSKNNTISNNTISDNYMSGGIFIQDSHNNSIFNNNFSNNTDDRGMSKHVNSDGESINYWNWSYPRGGNYWDDASKSIVDEVSGENYTIRKIPGPDGIGDEPYPIDGNNRDWYPLMKQYGAALKVFDACKVVTRKEGNTTTVCSVAVFSDSNVADFHLQAPPQTAGSVNFSVSGGTFCKVIISRKLLDGVFGVEVDDIPKAPFVNCDEDYVYVNFTFDNGNNRVEVQGAMVVTIKADVNGDGIVNIEDIFIVAKEFNSIVQNPR
jgi:parallel beta-helix repeat protein